MSDPSSFSTNRSPEAISPRAPDSWVWLAAAAIALMAAYGLYRGVTGVQSGGASLLPTPHAGSLVAPVDAANATPQAKDTQWSTLSGPQVVTPPPPVAVKAAKVAPSDDAADQSDNAAADASNGKTDDSAPDDIPPPPKTHVIKPAPTPDEDAPAANSPDAPL